MPKVQEHEPNALGENGSPTNTTDQQKRRRTRFNTPGTLRKTVGPESRLTSDYHRVSVHEPKKSDKTVRSFLPTFSFLGMHPFSIFKSSPPAPPQETIDIIKPPAPPQETIDIIKPSALPQETNDANESLSTSTLTTTDTDTTASKSSVGSSHSSRGSTSSSRSSITNLASRETPSKTKSRKALAADKTEQKKSNLNRQKSPKEKEELTKGTKKPDKALYAPQLSSRRHRTPSYLSLRKSAAAKIHPTSIPPTVSNSRQSMSDNTTTILLASESIATQSTSVPFTISNGEVSNLRSQTHTAITFNSNTKDTEVPKPASRYKTWRKKLGLQSGVIRLRHSRTSQVYKFTPFRNSADGEKPNRISNEVFMEDPLEINKIQKATNYKGWRKSVHMTLPSKIGVPVEESDDILNVGLNAVNATNNKNVDPREAYNHVFDSMQKHMTRKSLFNKPADDIKDPDKIFAQHLSALKTIPEHLAHKREYKQRLVSSKSGGGSLVRQRMSWKHRAGQSFSMVHNFLRDILFYCSIWRFTIRKIHGRFGITTAVYFSCIRSILVLHILYLATIIVFLVIPEIVIDARYPVPYNSEPSPGCYVQAKDCRLPPPKINKRKPFSVSDFITGSGSLDNTYLYFSGYRDNTAKPFCPLDPVAKLDIQYENPLSITAFRFVLVAFIFFIVNSVYISYRIVHYYHAAGLQTKIPGLSKKDLFRILLCAWDFSCTDPEGAKALHKSIRRELRELSGGLAKEKQDLLMTASKAEAVNCFVAKFGQKKGQIIIHWLLNGAVVLACAIATTVICLAYSSRILWISLEGRRCEAFASPPKLLLITPALFISITCELIASFCGWCSTFETWSTAENKNLTMFARVGLYYVANIGAIYGNGVYYANYLQKHAVKGSALEHGYSICYEELFGEEIYRVVVIHGCIHLLASWIPILYYWIRKKINSQYTKKPVFDPTYHALDILFVHTVCGVGYVYSPLISFIFIIRLIGIFYNNKLILSKFARLPEHLSHVSEISAPYFATFFMSYLIITVINVYIFVELDSSFSCGPFTHFHNANAPGQTPRGHYYNVLEEVLRAVTAGTFSKFAKPGFLWVFNFFLFGVIYTLKSWADGYALTLANLQELVEFEKKDRDFLLQAIFNVVREQASADDDFEDLEFEEENQDVHRPKRTSTWDESPLVTGIFENRRKSYMNRRQSVWNDPTTYVNQMDNLGADSHPRKSIVPDLPETSHDHPPGSRKKDSLADVWIKAYFDVRKARRHSNPAEELKNVGLKYGQN